MKIEVNYTVNGIHSTIRRFKTHTEYIDLLDFSGIVQIINGGSIDTVCIFNRIKGKSYHAVEEYALNKVYDYLGENVQCSYNQNCIESNLTYISTTEENHNQ